MAKKIYAVKRGRNTGLFNTWDECRAQVEGYQGAVYKGFMDIAEANAWMWGSSSAASAKKSAAGVSAAAQPSLFGTEEAETFTEDYVVYTDGSCLRNPDGPGGWAAVIREASTGKKKEISTPFAEMTLSSGPRTSARYAAASAAPKIRAAALSA